MKYLLENIARSLYHYFTNRNLREFHRLHDKWGKVERFKRVDKVPFLTYTFNIPDLPSFVWQFKDIFLEQIYRFKTASKVPVIFDCGSNIGASLLYFAITYPGARIIGFEADEDIAAVCEENMKTNGIQNVTVLKNAVWVHANGIDFSVQGGDGGSISRDGNFKRVRSVRLRDYLEAEEVVDFLKLDIEGAEYEVILDCANCINHVSNIFIEYHSWNNLDQKLSEILKVLEDNGFRYFIETINTRKIPFIDHGKERDMDLQLNIFAVKIC